LVWDSEYQWSAGETDWLEGRRNNIRSWNEQIIYEVHLKGLTASPASGVEHPGTYRGVAEMAPYLSDLGITAVEFLPTHEKPLDGGYWGYQTISFFAPEISYAATPRPLEIIDEFKAMVDALHAEGIEVYVDVVYNHTGEGGLWREKIQHDDVVLDANTRANLVNFDPKEVVGLYSFRGLDNQAYYALSEDNQTYWNNTGVGNQTRPNHRPFRKLILDSLLFYVEELHVDGFRFDLAPVLGASDTDHNSWAPIETTVLQDVIDDPVFQELNVRVIAEPWAAGGNYGFSLGGFPSATGEAGEAGVGWYEWNAHFRDWWRSFVNEDGFVLASKEGPADGGYTMTGSYDTFSWNGRRPYHSVNFITAHDGFTLYDLVSYEEKVNACGPLNPRCCDDPLSSFCDVDSGEQHNRSRNWADEAVKRQMVRNFFVALFVSQGTPMMLGGDEWMRTQLGNNNAYSTNSDNSFNWFDWGIWQPSLERVRMHDFVRKLIAFRKANLHAFGPSEYGGTALSWRSSTNGDDVAWAGKHVMQHYADPSGTEIAVLINMEAGPVTFTLPPGSWKRVADTQSYFDTPEYLASEGAPTDASANIDLDGTAVGASYEAQARSIVILTAD
ncbi:MAG: glycosyl hydrolase, partial [Deltaproteobacteria bacterium]|nr:glycosyl hydrolase [Deltaproteobacteria bacterium]